MKACFQITGCSPIAAKINKKHETRKRFRIFYMFLGDHYELATFLYQAEWQVTQR